MFLKYGFKYGSGDTDILARTRVHIKITGVLTYYVAVL